MTNLSKKQCNNLFLKAIIKAKLEKIDLSLHTFKKQVLQILNSYSWTQTELEAYINSITKSQFNSALDRADKLIQKLQYNNSDDVTINLTDIDKLKINVTPQFIYKSVLNTLNELRSIYNTEGELK